MSYLHYIIQALKAKSMKEPVIDAKQKEKIYRELFQEWSNDKQKEFKSLYPDKEDYEIIDMIFQLFNEDKSIHEKLEEKTIKKLEELNGKKL